MENRESNATELNNSLPPSDAELIANDVRHEVADTLSSADNANGAVEAAPAPKKRGRPRKTPTPQQNASDDALTESKSESASSDATPAPAPKKRGRPKKVIAPIESEPSAEPATCEADMSAAEAANGTADTNAADTKPSEADISVAEATSDTADTNAADTKSSEADMSASEAASDTADTNAADTKPSEADETSDSAPTEATDSEDSFDALGVMGEADSHEAQDAEQNESDGEEQTPDSLESESEEDADTSSAREPLENELSFEEQASVYSYGDEVYATSLFSDNTESEEAEENASKEEGYEVAADGSQLSFFHEDKPKVEVEFNEIPPFIPYTRKNSKVKPKKVYNSDYPRRSDTAFDFIELLIISLVAVLILTSFFFRHSKVQGNSMLQTLEDGDHLIISDFLYTPERGDIVVIEDYSTGYHFALVKRVIAIEGDTVAIINGQVYVNGMPLDEPYVYRDGYDRYPYFSPQVVPEGTIFVLGDHRNDSVDSRVFDFVDVDGVIGKALIRVYPFEKFGVIEE